MRRTIRIDRSVDRLLVRANPRVAQPYRCFACRQQASSFSTTSLREEQESFRERVRRKLLGNENVVTKRDPYSGPSQLSGEEAPVEAARPEPTAAAEPSSDYEPADTWDDLEMVGGFKGWWKQNWDPEHQFECWMPERSVGNAAEVSAALHRAVVEVFALKQAERPLSEVSQIKPGPNMTEKVQITPSTSGANLQFAEGSSLEQVVESLAPVKVPTKAKKSKKSAKVAPEPVAEEIALKDDVEGKTAIPSVTRKLVASWDPSWLQISLADPEIKFAVLKRTIQLTGIRVPDNVIKSSNTAKALLNHLITPPKPKKLVEELTAKADLVSLPNVSIWGRRITSIDKEQKIGRWKVIEEELKARNLPVKNTRFAPVV
ncbi:hypothetical protein ACMFMG_002811 [Clarireedia jacksonii]